MDNTHDTQPDALHLEGVTPDLTELSFCQADALALGQWIAALPLANTNETASLLQGATEELTRLQAAPALRVSSPRPGIRHCLPPP